jgi:hypothetical protein
VASVRTVKTASGAITAGDRYLAFQFTSQPGVTNGTRFTPVHLHIPDTSGPAGTVTRQPRRPQITFCNLMAGLVSDRHLIQAIRRPAPETWAMSRE